MTENANGYFTLNGQQFKVFDDTELKNQLSTIMDPDSNKIRVAALPEGYGVIQDPGSGAFVKTYAIELERWGIQPGIPAKPYTDDHYQMANSNVLGMNSAIQWATANGYSYLILPKNDYAICYPNPILIAYDNITFDFNSSTLKVIYDSDRKSPFDPRSNATDYFNFPGQPSGTTDGIAILLRRARNSHVKNVVLIGDKADRSFSNEAESKIEWTYGILFSTGCAYCSVSRCTISSFMGDGISINNLSYLEYVESSLSLTPNEVDTSGALIPSTNQTLVSKFINLPTATYDSFLIAGFGYDRVTLLNQKEVDVIYYDANNVILARYSNKKIYTPISIPPEAKKFRLLLRNETNPNKKMQMTFKYGLSPHHNLIENNVIFNLHRGGISLGGNYNLVRGNSIHDGMGLLDRKPIFPFSTRYGINQEDSYGDHVDLRDNLFYNVHHGILIGSWSSRIHNNLFYNLTGVAVNIYTIQSIQVTQNYIYRCQNGIGFMSSNLPDAHAFIENNTFVHVTNQSFTGSGFNVVFEHNTLMDVTTFGMQDDDTQICRENRFIWTDKFSGNPIVTANRMESSVFIGLNVQREIQLRSFDLVGSIFLNIFLRLGTRNQTTKTEALTIKDCTFRNCLVSNQLYLMKNRHVDMENSKLVDSVIKIGNINTSDQSATIRVTDSRIVTTTIPYFLLNESNTGFGRLEILHSTIEINNTSFLYFVTSIYTTANTASVILKNNAITYTGATPLTLPNFYDPAKRAAVRTFIDARNRYINIVLPQGEAGRYLDYDPAEEGTVPPTSGYWFRGDTYGHAHPTPGGYAGWICVAPGFASASAWNAGAATRAGDQITAAGRIYTARSSGTTGSAAPAWPAIARATVIDNGVTWQESGTPAQFKPYAPILEN